jgi:hypothetical protein
MNWKKLLYNFLGVFVAGYASTAATGAPQKVALLVGAGAVVTNATGLFQTPPHAE